MFVLMLAAGCLWATGRPAQAAQWPDPWRAQTGGWLRLTLDQARYREQEADIGRELTPEAAANLSVIERQEWLERRALDRRETQWIEDARRRERLPGVEKAGASPAVIDLRIERAEADERLRRDLRRRSSGPWPAATPNGPPPPFRLR